MRMIFGLAPRSEIPPAVIGWAVVQAQEGAYRRLQPPSLDGSSSSLFARFGCIFA